MDLRQGWLAQGFVLAYAFAGASGCVPTRGESGSSSSSSGGMIGPVSSSGLGTSTSDPDPSSQPASRSSSAGSTSIHHVSSSYAASSGCSCGGTTSYPIYSSSMSFTPEVCRAPSSSTVPGSSSGSTGTNPQELLAYLQQQEAAECARNERCAAVRGLATYTPQQCIDMFTSGRLAGLVQAGQPADHLMAGYYELGTEQDRAACLNEIANLPCTEEINLATSPCGRVFLAGPNAAQEGEPCSRDFDAYRPCAPNLACTNKGLQGSCSRCHPLAADGEPCWNYFECQSQRCQNQVSNGQGTCLSIADLKDEGEPCTWYWECRGNLNCWVRENQFCQRSALLDEPCGEAMLGAAPCVAGLECYRPDGGSVATCKPSPVPAVGTVCSRHSTSWECAPVHVCVFPSPSAETGTCQNPPQGMAPGSPCVAHVRKLGCLTPDLTPMIQESSTSPDYGCTCQPRKDLCQSCGDANQCLSRRCAATEDSQGTVCVVPGAAGMPCEKRTDCMSQLCMNNRCVESLSCGR